MNKRIGEKNGKTHIHTHNNDRIPNALQGYYCSLTLSRLHRSIKFDNRGGKIEHSQTTIINYNTQ